MTAQDLKNSILQLAMQGKLVPQDPNDEPASELLKRIKAEKVRLIKEGKIKKQKSPTPITEEEKPFEIPDSWEWVKLSQIVYNLGQKIPDEEFCYIDVGSIDNYAGRLSETNTLIKPENAPSRARKVVTHGAILYSCVRPYLLNTCIVDREFSRPPIASTAFAVLMPTEGIYNKYLHLYLRSPSFVSYTNTSSTGQAYPAINDKRLYDAVIPVPPHEEQMRIVTKIEELLPFIERYDESEKRLLELNKKFPDELRKSILQQAVQGKLTEQDPHDEPASELLKRIKAEKIRLIKEGKIKKEKPLPPISDDEIPFDIPESWEWVRLASIGFSQTGNTPSTSNPEYFGDDIPFITPGDILDGIICYDNRALSRIGKTVGRCCAPETILQVCIGGSIGKAAITKKEVAFNQQINSLSPIFCESSYIHLAVSSGYFVYTMKEKAGGTATPIINRGVWDALLIPLPPLPEQKRIVEKVEEFLSVCDNLQ